MKTRSMLVVVLCLVAGAIATPHAMAGKGKKLTLFLRWDGSDCGATYLSIEDAPDAGNSCAFRFQAAQEVLTAAGMGPLTHVWPSQLDKPVKLSKGVVEGTFVVKAYAAAATTLEVGLDAITQKGTVALGSFTSDPINTHWTAAVPVDIEIDIPKKLVGKKVESFVLSTTFRGVSTQSYIELDNPAAFLTFPVN